MLRCLNMPPTQVVLFAEVDGSVPLLQWLDRIPAKARTKCLARLHRLRELGHELRRPEADFLRDGIYELRTALNHVNYRMLYFFHDGRAVISHGLTKERSVPAREIDRAVRQSAQFARNPAKHTARG
jgi:phage-related protein